MPTLSRTVFFSLPSPQQLADAEAGIGARRQVLRRVRKSKLRPHLPFIAQCRQKKYSYQKICDLLMALHSLDVKDSTVLRFVKKQPFSTQLIQEVENHKQESAPTKSTSPE